MRFFVERSSHHYMLNCMQVTNRRIQFRGNVCHAAAEWVYRSGGWTSARHPAEHEDPPALRREAEPRPPDRRVAAHDPVQAGPDPRRWVEAVEVTEGACERRVRSGQAEQRRGVEEGLTWKCAGGVCESCKCGLSKRELVLL
jgi:hypothetical protein